MYYENYIKFGDMLSETNLYQRLKSKAQKELNFNIIFSKFISNITTCKNTFLQTPEHANIQRSLDIIFLTCDLTDNEIDELKSILQESNLSSVIHIRDSEYKKNYFYDYGTNNIVPPQPHSSWTLDANGWQPPHPCLGSEFPYWCEELYQLDNTKGWVINKPFESWILNQETTDWESPVGPAPELTEEERAAFSFYRWNEEAGAWELETPPAPEG